MKFICVFKVEQAEGNGNMVSFANDMTDYLEECRSLDQIDEQELANLDKITFDQVNALNGKHFIYGLLEGFEQSSDRPDWYDRKHNLYTFHSYVKE